MALNTKKTKQLFDELLKEITPTKEDDVLKQVNAFLADAEKEAKKLKIRAMPVLGGSFAKNTWLKGDYDVDIFFAFDLKYKDTDLSEMLSRILAKFKPLRIHGSRDYFQIRNGMCLEIIPVLNIKKAADAQNVTDFSLWHVDWTNKKGKKLKNDIRIAKKFCKAQRVYGAESYIRGFSGHVLDILVIHYGGFLQLLKAATKWTPKVIIDTENYHKGKALQFINKSKTESALLVVDPVQPGRNASAAISQEQFDKFVKSATQFIKNPSQEFFIKKPIDENLLRKKGTLLKIFITPVEGVENVIGVKMLKAGQFLQKKLEDFEVVLTEWEWDKKNPAVWHYVVRKKELPAETTFEGPPLKFKEHCDRFKKAHKKTFIKSGKVFATITREFTTPQQIIKAAISDNYLKDKAKKITLQE